MEQPVTVALDPRDLGGKLVGRELIALVMKMDGIAKQGLHGSRPGQGGIGVHHRLQVAQLVRQAELALFGRGFQLCAKAIAHPHFGLALSMNSRITSSLRLKRITCQMALPVQKTHSHQLSPSTRLLVSSLWITALCRTVF